jgi:hypothetical protein
MEKGQIVVDSLTPMSLADITDDLARESGFSDAKNLLQTAKHGRGDNVYLVRFHYLPPGAWDVPRGTEDRGKERTGSGRPSSSRRKSTLLQRIRTSPPGHYLRKGAATARWSRRRGE